MSVQNQQLLILDTISPTWAKRLEESKLLPLLSLERLQLYLELRDASKCVVGEACIRSYSKLQGTKNELVNHWSEKHRYACF